MTILAIVGPTGIGKSEVAVEFAHRIPAEVVSVDSMQVYRGMDLGTGKPPSAVRREIPHHGLDLADPGEEFNAAQYAAMVRPIIAEIRARGKLPILVGGSGLYFRALLDGLCDAPGRDLATREQLLAEGREKGSAPLHQKLRAVDPEAAGRVHPNDLRRIIRALEVFLVTGRSLSQWQRESFSSPLSAPEILRIGLTCQRDLLYRRIEERVEGWLAAGWVEEARSLRARSLSRTAREALGYGELFDFIDGRSDWETTRNLIRRNTCRYAKRQWSWFRADPRVEWIQTDGKKSALLAQEIVKQWNARFSLPSA